MTLVSRKTLFITCGIIASWTLVNTVSTVFMSSRIFRVEDAVIETLGGVGGQRANPTNLLTGGVPAIVPLQNDTYDFGSATSSWKNVYVSSTIHTPITGATTTPFKLGKVCIPVLNSDGAQRYLFINGTTWTVSTVNCGSI